MKKNNYLMGTTGALLGGIIGTIPWILVEVTTQFFIGWLGYLIGISSLYGYRKLGGNETIKSKWIILGATIFSVFFAECVTTLIYLYQEGYDPSISNLLILFQDSSFVKGFMLNVGVGLLIAFFGIKSIFDGIGKNK
jgi:mannose/fructose/N-acetylgalactosamine-specific phosphotransferase system component IID